jgi:hypothetical protein
MGVQVDAAADVPDIRKSIVKAKLGERYRADSGKAYIDAAYDMIVMQAGERADAYGRIGQTLSAPAAAPRQDSMSPEAAFMANLGKGFKR